MVHPRSRAVQREHIQHAEVLVPGRRDDEARDDGVRGSLQGEGDGPCPVPRPPARLAQQTPREHANDRAAAEDGGEEEDDGICGAEEAKVIGAGGALGSGDVEGRDDPFDGDGREDYRAVVSGAVRARVDAEIQRELGLRGLLAGRRFRREVEGGWSWGATPGAVDNDDAPRIEKHLGGAAQLWRPWGKRGGF